MTGRAELTEAELHELIDRDPLAALYYLVEQAGGTMRLQGAPVSEAELRAHVERSAMARIEAAIERGAHGQVGAGDVDTSTEDP